MSTAVDPESANCRGSRPPSVGSATTPSPTARAGSGILHRADPPTKPPLRRMPRPGNARRARRQASLGQYRRPPRSFSGGAVPFLVRQTLPLLKTRRAGVPKVLQKAGDGSQNPGTAPIHRGHSSFLQRVMGLHRRLGRGRWIGPCNLSWITAPVAEMAAERQNQFKRSTTSPHGKPPTHAPGYQAG